MKQIMSNIIICGRSVKKNYYTLDRPLEFTTDKVSYFGHLTIPAKTRVKFFETINFGFVKYIDENGNVRIAKE